MDPWSAGISIGTSLLGALSGLWNKPKPITTTTEQHQSTDMNTMPQYDAKSQALRDMLINYNMDNLQSNDDVFNGYTMTGLNNINQGADAANRNIQNLLAARGIRGNAGAWAQTAPQLNRLQQQTTFMNGIPLLKDQRRQQILGQTNQFLQSLPVGQHQYGTTDMTGKQVQSQPSSSAGQFTGNLYNGLMGMYGAGAFSPSQSSQNQNAYANYMQNYAPTYNGPWGGESSNPTPYGPGNIDFGRG